MGLYKIRFKTTAPHEIQSDDFLIHFGIKGQKWGIRRFQNEDGSLTEAGRARVAKKAGYGYLNSPKKNSAEREKIEKQYTEAYWTEVSKGMSTNYPTEIGKKLWDRYKERYASATLKDLKLKNTSRARKDVKRLLAEIDSNYKYDDPSDYDPDRHKKFLDHRKEVEHPHKTRLKKQVKNVKEFIDTAGSIKKLVL